MKNISAVIMMMAVFSGCLVTAQNPREVTAKDVITAIIEHTGSPEIGNTVDVFKEGNPDTRVTGIATCMFPTMEVLKKAAESGCNLIIAHEPLYYNHLDETQMFLNDPVFKAKKQFIEDNHLVIWRFHDYIHSMNPDGILLGMKIRLGWLDYTSPARQEHIIIPEKSLSELLAELKTAFPSSTFNVVGDPDLRVKNIWYAAGAPGSENQLGMLQREDADVLISGEVPQWETYEYMRDAVFQGKKKAVIFLGHVPSEEAGMEWCARWISGFITGVPVQFIECRPSYWSY